MNTGFKLMRLGILIMIVLSGFTILPNLFSDGAVAPQGMPTVNVALTETDKSANVGPGETGVVTFTGVATVTLNQATRVVVSLTATDTWGTAVASPSSLLFDQNGDKPFSVSVRARPRESFANTGTVTVTGQWSMYPGALSGPANPREGANGRININQFFKFTLKASKPFQETSPGSQIVYTMTIQNKGNFQDTFTVDIPDYEKLSKKKFEITLSQYNLEIFENPAEENVRIQVNTPLDWTVYKVEYTSIKIQVVSDNGIKEGLPPQAFVFVVREKGFYIPGFDSSIMLFSLMFILIFFSYGYKKYGGRIR